MVGPRDVEVTLVHPCRHFTQTYGLNRFLALLLAHGTTRIRPELALRDYDPRSGAASAVAAPRCTTAASGASAALGVFDHVVVRHGVTAPPVAGLRWPRPNDRQILPFHPA